MRGPRGAAGPAGKHYWSIHVTCRHHDIREPLRPRVEFHRPASRGCRCARRAGGEGGNAGRDKDPGYADLVYHLDNPCTLSLTLQPRSAYNIPHYSTRVRKSYYATLWSTLLLIPLQGITLRTARPRSWLFRAKVGVGQKKKRRSRSKPENGEEIAGRRPLRIVTSLSKREPHSPLVYFHHIFSLSPDFVPYGPPPNLNCIFSIFSILHPFSF